jgi:hypothetical protein
MQTFARVLLTLTVVGYALVTMIADFNETHATNPKWTAHARFHVVWQVLSYVGIGLVAVYLIWIEGPNPQERLYLAAALTPRSMGASLPPPSLARFSGAPCTTIMVTDCSRLR